MINKPLKVCNISCQGYTGIAYYDHSFTRSLAEAGVDMTLVTSKRWLVDTQQAHYKIKMFFVNTYGERSRLVKGLYYLKGMVKTFGYVIKNRISIVHFQLLELPVVDLLFFHLFKLCGIKIVYSPHDIYNFKYSLNRRMILRFFNLSHIIIAHNTANIQLLKKDFDIPDTKLRLIRQGNMNDFLHPNLSRDQARRQIGLALDKKIILFFGNIREGKGAETAVRAIAGIPDKRDILFVMAGKPMRGYDLREIETTLTRQDIKTHALMRLQFIEEKDVEAYYKSADIVLVPYEKIYTSAVICYAFSCGCATIVSDVKEFADFVRDGENTIVFTAGDHLDLTAKMVQLLENPQLLKKIAHNAKHFADHEWAWEKTANQLKEIYSAL